MAAGDPGNHDTVDTLCGLILSTLSFVEQIQNRFHPFTLSHFEKELRSVKTDLNKAINAVENGSCPAENSDRPSLVEAAILLDRALSLLLASTDTEQRVVNFMKATRRCCRAQELLFSIRQRFVAVDRYFLEPQALKCIGAELTNSAPDLKTGLHHIGMDETPYARGGFSLYIPDQCDRGEALPLIVALHGGFGHGRDFIWTWLREARSRGFLLLAPTSRDTTWSFFNPDSDGIRIERALRYVTERWPIDYSRLLLTGISDGAIFTLTWGLRKESPFSALAPVSAVLHPIDLSHARRHRILWVHGALDWMFPPQHAKQGYALLQRAGANIKLRIVEDLAHAYPREQNDCILRWFDPSMDYANRSHLGKT